MGKWPKALALWLNHGTRQEEAKLVRGSLLATLFRRLTGDLLRRSVSPLHLVAGGDRAVAFGKQMRASHKAGKYCLCCCGRPQAARAWWTTYWLLRICSAPYKASTKLKAWDDPRATVIPRGTWVVRAQWYLSTAEDHRAKRHAYKLLPEEVP